MSHQIASSTIRQVRIPPGPSNNPPPLADETHLASVRETQPGPRVKLVMVHDGTNDRHMMLENEVVHNQLKRIYLSLEPNH